MYIGWQVTRFSVDASPKLFLNPFFALLGLLSGCSQLADSVELGVALPGAYLPPEFSLVSWNVGKGGFSKPSTVMVVSGIPCLGRLGPIRSGGPSFVTVTVWVGPTDPSSLRSLGVRRGNGARSDFHGLSTDAGLAPQSPKRRWGGGGNRGARS